MPELPDLQVFSSNLTKRLHAKTIKQVSLVTDPKLNVSAKQLKEALEGSSVDTVRRVGKELHIECTNGAVLALHLMLHGQLFICRDKCDEYSHKIIYLTFTDHSILVLTDYQGLAKPTLNPEPPRSPDILSKEADETFFKKQFAVSRTTIKNLLMDQKIIRGIGNAYADEILWDAGIHPQSIINKIPPEKVKALIKSIKKVLEYAEKQILATHPEIISGEIRDFLLIHNPHKTHSPTGAVIHVLKTGSRKTYYTEEQEIYK